MRKKEPEKERERERERGGGRREGNDVAYRVSNCSRAFDDSRNTVYIFIYCRFESALSKDENRRKQNKQLNSYDIWILALIK
jgi:hypothetical protein